MDVQFAFAAEAAVIRCDYCAGPTQWTVIADTVHYYCLAQCDGFMQIDCFDEIVVQPTSPAGRNFPHDSEYARAERELSGLPW